MSAVRTHTQKFSIGEVAFYHYHAQDSHGTMTDTFMVDNKIVSSGQFYLTLRETLQPLQHYVLRSLGAMTYYTPDWKA